MVSAQAATLQTDRAEVQTQLNTASLEELPVPPEPQLSESARHHSRLHAALNTHSIAANPVACAELQRERRDAQLERRSHRRRRGAQRLAAARGRLRAGARSDRNGECRHEQLRRRSGPGGRIGDQPADEERHQQFHGSAFTFHGDEAHEIAGRTFCRPIEEKPKCMRQPVRRHGRRSDQARQAVLLRLATTASSIAARGYDASHRPDGGDARRRLLGVARRRFTIPTTGNADGTGRTAFPGNRIPHESIRSDRAENPREHAAAHPGRRRSRTITSRRATSASPATSTTAS